jgi:outer membrane beta-barrel protein
MNPQRFAPVLAVALFTSGAAALAQTSARENREELVESVAVRNRLYTPGGRWEIGPAVGLTVLSRLTNHYLFNLGAAYNFSDKFAAEIRGGYAYSFQTALARDAAAMLLVADPAVTKQVRSDFADLWQMRASAIVGVRWAPIYGKISLMAEVPVHFQTYLAAGIGGGTFHRQSLVMCLQADRSQGTCANYYQEDKFKPILSGALGFRFFTHQGGGLKVEIRTWTFPDSYRLLIDRKLAETGEVNGDERGSRGFTNLVFFDLGYSFLF